MISDSLLQAIIDDPDDDSYRWIFADFLEERGEKDRAEFIRTQLELNRLGEADERRSTLINRQDELLKLHEKEWTDECCGQAVKSATFRRGFVESIELSAEEFLRHGDVIVRAAPVTCVHFSSEWTDARFVFRRLNDTPALSRLRSATFRFGCYELIDADLHVLAEVPSLLGRMAALSILECSIIAPSLLGVLMSPCIRQLSKLSVIDCSLNNGQWLEALAASSMAYHINILELDHNSIDTASLRSLANSAYCDNIAVLSLCACGLDDAAAHVLAESDRLGRVKSMLLGHNRIGDEGVMSLAGSCRLKGVEYLHLNGNDIGDSGALAIERSPYLRGIKGLALWENDISPLIAERLKARFGTCVQL